MSNPVKQPAQAVIELKRAIMNDPRSVEALAIAAGVDRNTIWLWVEGKTKNPNISEVEKVANALGYKLRLDPTPPETPKRPAAARRRTRL